MLAPADVVLLARATVPAQLAGLEQVLTANPAVTAVLDALADLDLPDGWLTAGGLFQTVWNAAAGRDPQAGITDYDVFYFDPDTSSAAQADVQARVRARLPDLPVDVVNEARVHLWYPEAHGVAVPPFTSSRHAVDCFAATTCCLGVRPAPSGLDVYAPHGLADVFAGVVRPNPVIATAAAYAAKTARWQREWPHLTVLPWPSDRPAGRPPEPARRGEGPDPFAGR